MSVLWSVLALELVGTGSVSAICGGPEGTLRGDLDGIIVTADGEHLAIESLESAVESPTVDPAPVALGYDTAGVAYELLLNDGGWSLRRQGAEVPLKLPTWLRPATPLRVLGQAVSRVWLGGQDLIVVVDVETGMVSAARLGHPLLRPIPLQIGEAAELIVGAELVRCATPQRCESVGRFSGPVSAAVVDDGFIVLAMGGREPGLFRASVMTPLVVFRLLSGDVLALCGGREPPTWALMHRAADLVWVAASPDTPAVRLLNSAELMTAAFLETPTVDVEVGRRLLDRARVERWPALLTLALTFARDTRPTMRALAASVLADQDPSKALAALWILSRDSDVEVRLAALESSRARCERARQPSCQRTLIWFIGDADLDVSFGARDGLLQDDPALAFAGAPLAYRRDAVATLASQAERHGFEVARRGLELLAQDADAAVRDGARRALEAVTP